MNKLNELVWRYTHHNHNRVGSSLHIYLEALATYTLFWALEIYGEKHRKKRF